MTRGILTDGQKCSHPRAIQRLFSQNDQNYQEFPVIRLNVYEKTASIQVARVDAAKTAKNEQE